MNPSPLPLQQLCDTAVEAARAAGHFIESVDRESIQRQYKETGTTAASQLVTEVDVGSEAIIRQHLEESCELWDIAFVGEESLQEARDELPERLNKPWFWCVDPLDGTLPFVEGKPGYAVSIALVEQSGEPRMGIVYDPVTGTLTQAIKGQGAHRDGAVICPASHSAQRLTVFADASFRTQDDYDEVVGVLDDCASRVGLDGLEIVYGNGAVKNACQVLEHAAACYIKLPKPEDGGGSIWDFAATACIVREAGAWVSNIHGGELDLNRRDSTFMNHQGVVFASSEQLASTLIDGLSPLVDHAPG